MFTSYFYGTAANRPLLSVPSNCKFKSRRRIERKSERDQGKAESRPQRGAADLLPNPKHGLFASFEVHPMLTLASRQLRSLLDASYFSGHCRNTCDQHAVKLKGERPASVLNVRYWKHKRHLGILHRNINGYSKRPSGQMVQCRRCA